MKSGGPNEHKRYFSRCTKNDISLHFLHLRSSFVTKKKRFKTKHHIGRPCESKQPCNL